MHALVLLNNNSIYWKEIIFLMRYVILKYTENENKFTDLDSIELPFERWFSLSYVENRPASGVTRALL